jgi:hypothetical protein
MRIDAGSQLAAAARPAPAAQPRPAPAPPPVQPRPAPARPSLGEAAHEAFVDAAMNLKRALGPMHHTDLNIDVDVRSQSVAIRVVDQRTGDVVREIPPDALKRFAEAFDVYLGTLFDKEA